MTIQQPLALVCGAKNLFLVGLNLLFKASVYLADLFILEPMLIFEYSVCR